MKAGKPPGATEIVIVQYNTKIQFAHFIGSVRAGEILEIHPPGNPEKMHKSLNIYLFYYYNQINNTKMNVWKQKRK